MRYLVVLTVVIGFTAGCASNVRMAGGFKSERSRIKSIAVVPPDIDFYVRGYDRQKAAPEFGSNVAVNVQDALVQLLGNQGIRTVSRARTDSLFQSDLWLRGQLQDAHESFSRSSSAISDNVSDNVSFVLVADLEPFANIVRADYVLMVRGHGYIGTRAFQNLLGKNANGLFLEIALLDPATSKILWFNRNIQNQSGCEPLQRGSVEELCQKLLRRLLSS